LVHVNRVGVGDGGFAVYMTEWDGRGAVSPMGTRSVCVVDNDLKSLSINFAAKSARSLPRMFVCDLILCKVVLRPIGLLVSMSSAMLSRSRSWWW
jgi:hypothetical protein